MLRATALTRDSPMCRVCIADLRRAIAAGSMGELEPCLREDLNAEHVLEHVQTGGVACAVTDGGEPVCLAASVASGLSTGFALRVHVLADSRLRGDLPAALRLAAVHAEQVAGDPCQAVVFLRQCRFAGDRVALQASWSKVDEWRWETGPLVPARVVDARPTGVAFAPVPPSPDAALLALDVGGRIAVEERRYDPALSVMAATQGQPCAFVLAHGTAGYLVVDMLCVAEGSRRRGLGSALLARALDAGRRAGLSSAVSIRNVGNGLVDGLLRRFGWSPACDDALQGSQPNWR